MRALVHRQCRGVTTILTPTAIGRHLEHIADSLEPVTHAEAAGYEQAKPYNETSCPNI
jgi:hypothetical protein